MEGRLVRTINGHEAYVRSAYFSPQGEKVITASGDKTAVVWPSTREIDAWIDKVGMYKLAPEDWRELGVDNMQ
jgi:WD40 repeat protein